MSTRRRQDRRARADAGAPASASVTLTPHAAGRAYELGFSWQEVAGAVSAPEQSYPCHRAYGPRRRLYQRDDVAVVLAEDTREIVTVLLRRPDRWRHGVDTRTSCPVTA